MSPFIENANSLSQKTDQLCVGRGDLKERWQGHKEVGGTGGYDLDGGDDITSMSKFLKF
jgi:hypothetical protein